MQSMLRSMVVLATSVLLVSCARGAPDVEASIATRDDAQSQSAGAGGTAMMTGGAGSIAMQEMQDASVPMFDGDPCVQGDAMPCACEGTGETGMRVCLASSASPTGGEYSECRGCPAAAPDAGADPLGGASGMMTSGGAGGTVSAGTGGAGGMSTTGGSGGAGTGASGAGGAGGAGGTTAACTCTDLLACCRDDGTCGIGVPGLCL